MSQGRTGAGAARRPDGYGGAGDPGIASALVLPRLAALGPALDLETIRSPYYEDEVVSRFSKITRIGQMGLATVIGLLMLAAPMAALGWAANEAYAIVVADAKHRAPGQAPTWQSPGSVLDPAYKGPHR